MNAVSEAVTADAFELKSAQFSLPSLLLKNTNLDAISGLMEQRVNSAPAFFNNTPVIIDLRDLPANAAVDFPWLVGLLRGHGMIPFGVKGAAGEQKEMAELMELALLLDHQHASSNRPSAKPAATRHSKTSAAAGRAQNKLITTPVRSGQRIYAAGGDLIITAQVSSGAEVIADGNIHIYGTLRGRALAGVKGNRDARIFCHNLQADLIAIAGQYRLFDDVPASRRECPVQIYLADDNRLSIETL